jgi:hypothetical protein
MSGFKMKGFAGEIFIIILEFACKPAPDGGAAFSHI